MRNGPREMRFGVFLSLVDRPDVVPTRLWSRAALASIEELHRREHAVHPDGAAEKGIRSAA